ncbi:MAG: pilus motility taxis protein HmpF [Cyanobacteria bacterium J06560_2]
MLYLAETQKKSGFMGGGKAEFKLLAAQRSEHDWSGVPGEEMIAAPDDAPYASGVLVLIELTNNRQIKRHQEAGKTLVSVLQNFSGLSKKFKSQGEEIEQWKESLTFQSQALNRREMEIEARQEQIEQAEADIAKVETEKQAVEAQKTEVEELQESLTRKNAELEGAWAHLNGEIQRFEERQENTASSASAGISDEQSHQLQAVIAQLTQDTEGPAALAESIADALALVARYEADLAEEQQLLAQKREAADTSQLSLEAAKEAVVGAKQSLTEAESGLHSTHIHLQQQQSLLGAKQAQNQLLTDQLKNQTDLHQQVYELLNATDKVRLSKKVDVSALEAMAEEDLQALVTSLEQDLDKMVRFVNDQEEELKLQQDDIDALTAKLDSASEYDRLQIETEIAEEKDRHVMLNRTLVGQRRNLLEREEVLSQHRAVLLRRQGLAAQGTGAAADLEPVLDEIDKLRAGLGEQIQQVEGEIAQIQTEIDALKQTRQQQKVQLEEQRQAIGEVEENYGAWHRHSGEAHGQVALYEHLLSAAEERLSNFNQQLSSLSERVASLQSVEAQQQAALANVQQVLQSISAPEPALV